MVPEKQFSCISPLLVLPLSCNEKLLVPDLSTTSFASAHKYEMVRVYYASLDCQVVWGLR